MNGALWLNLLLAWQSPWLDRLAHPEEWAPAFLVGAGIFGGGFLLLRVIFSGGKGPEVAPLPSKRFASVVVPVDGREVTVDAFLGDAVPLACALSTPGAGAGAGADGGSACTIRLTYVIAVPRALAVDAPMPEEEAEAGRVLERAAEAVRGRGLQATTHVQKGRTFADGTLRAVSEAGGDLLVLSLPTSSLGETDGEGAFVDAGSLDASAVAAPAGDSPVPTLELGAYETAQTPLGQVLRRCPCEVVFARPSPFA